MRIFSGQMRRGLKAPSAERLAHPVRRHEAPLAILGASLEELQVFGVLVPRVDDRAVRLDCINIWEYPVELPLPIPALDGLQRPVQFREVSGFHAVFTPCDHYILCFEPDNIAKFTEIQLTR